MRKRRLITAGIATVGILSLVCLIGYNLALHDIFHDYASPNVLQEQAGLTEANLPDWTECPREWWFIRVGFWPMLAFHVLILIGLAWYFRKNTHSPHLKEMETGVNDHPQSGWLGFPAIGRKDKSTSVL